MKNKFIITFTVTLLTIGGLSAQNSNVGYISRDSIIKSTPGYLEKSREVQNLLKTYQDEIKNKREALNQRAAALLQSYNVKPEESQQQILARMASKDTTAVGMMRQEELLIKQTEKLYTAKVNTLFEQEVKPIEGKIAAAIRSYALKNKLDMIYFIEDISPALAYIDTKRNVTAAVIKEIVGGK